MNLTAAFCQNLRGISRESLDASAIAAARRLVLDGIAVAAAGSREDAPHILGDYLRDLGGNPQATAIGGGFQTSVVGAAYLNGAAMHVLDYEPMWNPATHALSTTLPAILALAEKHAVNGAAIIAALVAGVEAQGRLRVASRQYEAGAFSFHPPGMVGVIGSAVASSNLLALSQDQMCNAIGIAASRSGTLLANAGTMTKCTHCGMAAAMGLESALLAARGFTANPDVIAAPHGYAQAFFGPDYDEAALTRTDAPLRMVEPGYATKMFPSQYATHFAITAALEARRRIPSAASIRTVEIVAPVMQYVDRPYPATGLEGKFSFQYTAACALLYGAVRINTFTDEHCHRHEIVALLSRTHLRQTKEIPAALDRMWVEITVELAGDERIVARCARPHGAWGEPIPRDEYLVKARDCLGRLLDPHATETIIDRSDCFERLGSEEIRELMRTLGSFDTCPQA
ncbi:MAG: MmgE/PrpD family protein [Candidatus Binataceae bacterium]